MASLRITSLLSILIGCAHPRPKLPLVTTGEQSGYTRTGRYEEAEALCRDFARAYEGASCLTIGRTVEDRPIVAVAIRRGDKPWIYLQGGIHAGEIEGKDAGFWFLRDLLNGRVAPGALDAVNVIFVPVINPDGHERFGPNHRANQRGPIEMGFRTTASRLNMNRDFVKADAPETQAAIGVLAKYDPILFVDLHTTDGAKFEHDISINMTPAAPRATDGLFVLASETATAIADRLTALGHLPVTFYPSFVKDDDPSSGFELGEAPPRFGHYYYSARGRMGLLVEMHSWRTYKERVQSCYHALQAIFELAAKAAPAWRKIENEATLADTKLAGKRVPIMWKASETPSHTIDFRGYAYEKRPSEISGGTWIVYDETKPEIWKTPIFDKLEPAVTIDFPTKGYYVDGGFANVVKAILDRHALRYEPATGTIDLQVFRATKAKPDKGYEGRVRIAVEGAWTKETRTLDRNAIFVPIDQPGARLIAHLFEPSLPDSLAQWGLFSVVFERKEYMEAYVAEETARAMLAKDPALKAQFDAAVAADPEMQKSPEARLDWFYKRSAAWDERVNLLPVYKR